MKIPRAGAHFGIKTRNGFQIVVKHIGFRGNHLLQGFRGATDKIRGQNLNGCAGRLLANCANGLSKMRRAAIFNIIPIHGGHNNMVKTQLFNGICHPARLEHIQIFWWFPGGNIAKGTGPCAHFPHDHHRRMALIPAFSHIWAAGLFTDGHKLMFTHNFACLLIALSHRGFNANPRRLFRLRIVRPFGFFRMALLGNF